MALLKTNDAAAIRTRFQRELVDDVRIDFYTASRAGLIVPGQECEYCATVQQLLEEVAALDPRLKLHIHDATTDADGPQREPVHRIPATIVSRDGRSGVRFYGIPSGFEFAVLIEDLIAVSRNESGLAPETKARLKGLSQDVHVQVFVTPTCPHCPGASHVAHMMALESARITADVVEATEFPALADKYGVYGVPKIVLNDTLSFEGAQPESRFLEQVMTAGRGTAAVAAGTSGEE